MIKLFKYQKNSNFRRKVADVLGGEDEKVQWERKVNCDCNSVM